MYFYHDRVQRNANDHLYPVLLSDFPADLRIVDAGGIIRHVYRSTDQHLQGKLPLFRYGVVMVTVLYLALSFSHPDYIIARVNIANAPGGDFSYLSDLSADAAPAIIPYMESLGYDFGAYELERPTDIMSEDTQAQWWGVINRRDSDIIT